MSTYGTLLKVTSFGESHGKGVGCVIDGFLPNININFDFIQKQLNRRRPNQSILTSSRNEKDKLVVLSGFDENKTLGTPITFLIYNEDVKKENYSSFINIPRPGHGDYTYFMKYNVKNKSGSSRFSGRETVTRVAAGACIEQWLSNFYNCTIICYVHSVGNIKLPEDIYKEFEKNPPSRNFIDTYGCVKYNKKKNIFIDYFNNIYDINGFLIDDIKKKEHFADIQNCMMKEKENMDEVNEWVNLQTRCPHPYTAVQISSYILKIKDKGDSIGGIATCVIKNAPIGIGEPIFDKTESELAKIILSIPAIKGIEFGSGFNGTYLFGSENNDIFIPFDKKKEQEKGISEGINNAHNDQKKEEKDDYEREYDKNILNEDKNKYMEYLDNTCKNISNEENILTTKTNNCGGILAGITTGNNIVFRVAVKPVSSIQIEKETCDFKGNFCKLSVKGMHDSCILPRLPPIIESSSAIVIGDLILRQIAKYGNKNLPSLSVCK